MAGRRWAAQAVRASGSAEAVVLQEEEEEEEEGHDSSLRTWELTAWMMNWNSVTRPCFLLGIDSLIARGR